MMLYTNLAAVILSGAIAAATGQLQQGMDFVTANPTVLNAVGWFSLLSAVGQNFIFMTIQNFDALLLTTVTTTRKFFTILVSVLLYGHSLNAKQWASVGVVFVGLSGEVYEKYEKKSREGRAKERVQGKGRPSNGDKNVKAQGKRQ